jgi:hypothetical protein
MDPEGKEVSTFKTKGKLSSDVGTGNTAYSKKCKR